jgi:quercetin dioxygenase-like cupin family protein
MTTAEVQRRATLELTLGGALAMNPISRPSTVLGCVSAALLGLALASAQHDSAAPLSDHAIHLPTQIKWADGPPSLPRGAKFAVLEGDPAKDGFFTMRIRVPDGYEIPPHTHPKVEHVTVISGAFNFGMGEKFGRAETKEMPAGTFGFWPAGMKHFAWARGETVVQLHGIGPWSIEYLDPADDPRNAK